MTVALIEFPEVDAERFAQFSPMLAEKMEEFGCLRVQVLEEIRPGGHVFVLTEWTEGDMIAAFMSSDEGLDSLINLGMTNH